MLTTSPSATRSDPDRTRRLPTKTRPSSTALASPPAARTTSPTVRGSPRVTRHCFDMGLHRAALGDALDDAAIAVDAQPVPGADAAGRARHVDDARHTELARDDGRVRERTAE